MRRLLRTKFEFHANRAGYTEARALLPEYSPGCNPPSYEALMQQVSTAQASSGQPPNPSLPAIFWVALKYLIKVTMLGEPYYLQYIPVMVT